MVLEAVDFGLRLVQVLWQLPGASFEADGPGGGQRRTHLGTASCMRRWIGQVGWSNLMLSATEISMHPTFLANQWYSLAIPSETIINHH